VTKEFRLTYGELVDGVIDPATVGYVCAQCRKVIPERYKQQMLNAGKWIAKFPGRPVVGFFINALYSPWQENWHALATEWVEAQKDKNPEKLKAFINLRLGETWEEDAEGVEKDSLVARREVYKAEVPTGVGILTASVDVQGDRLECVVKGWGEGEESWLIAYQQFFGDPGDNQVWGEVDQFLLTTFKHESGQQVPISATMVDSGGLHTDEVYRFCVARMNRRIFPLKGSSESGKEILHKFSLNNNYHVKLWTIGTDTAKDRIFARMKIPAPAKGYMHLPDWVESEYLEQLTAEKAVRRYKKGRGVVREYVKTRSRNEALDLEVYALAALYIFGSQTIRSLPDLAKKLADPNPPEILPGAGGRNIRHPGIS
jgi:terminase, large subunit